MVLQSRPVWTIQLDHNEFLLVSRALRGILKPEESNAARTLGDMLSVLKAKRGLHETHENEKLIDNLEKAGLWEEERS